MATPEDQIPFSEEVVLLPGEMLPEERDDFVPDRRENLVGRMLEEAIKWHEEVVEPEMERSTKYYNGDISDDVPNVEGRSQAVSRDVQDTARMILPPLSDIFFGPDAAVEYEPEGTEDIALAKMMTRFVDRVVIRKDNKGKRIFRGVHKDALVRMLGIVKVWYDEGEAIERSEQTGLTPEAVAILLRDPEVEVDLFGPDEEGFFDAIVTRMPKDPGRVKFDVLAPEEVVWSPDARSPEDARLIAHVREMPANELIEMGFDPEVVGRHKGPSQQRSRTGLDAARRIDGGAWSTEEDTQADETRPVLVAECYVKLPIVMEDDRPESEEPPPVALHKVWALGQGEAWEIVEEELWDFLPIVFWGPDPEPNSFVGNSIAGLVEDIQRIKSLILRGILDSLSSHLDPATVVGPGVNLNDVLNRERGRIIRADRMDQITELTQEFVGGAGLEVFGAMTEIRSGRVGVSPESMGLDADALQSSTPIGVNQIIKAAQAPIKEIAWIFADSYAEFYRIILKTLVKNQNGPRQVRFGNQFVEVDPRAWNADLDVTVKVGLGANHTEEKIGEITAEIEEQKEHLLAGSPLGDVIRLRGLYARRAELMGRNADEIWPTVEEIQEKMSQPPEPSSEERLQQIEMEKIAQRDREAQLEAQVRLAVEQMKAGVSVQGTQVSAALDAAKIALDREKAEVETVRGASE